MTAHETTAQLLERRHRLLVERIEGKHSNILAGGGFELAATMKSTRELKSEVYGIRLDRAGLLPNVNRLAETALLHQQASQSRQGGYAGRAPSQQLPISDFRGIDPSSVLMQLGQPRLPLLRIE